MSRYDIVRNLFAPKRKAYAALYNPAAPGSLIGSLTLTKTVDVSAFVVGATKVISLSTGGMVRIESIVAQISTTITGAGASVGLGYTSGGSSELTPATAAPINAPAMLRGPSNAAANTQLTWGTVGATFDSADGNGQGGATQQPTAHAILSASGSNFDGVYVRVLGGNLTAGVIVFRIIYTPLIAGSTLS